MTFRPLDDAPSLARKTALVRVLSWYDNEWGFATRLSDTALAMAKFL